MAQHNIPFEDEGVVRTDEQAGTAKDILARAEKQYDAAHPPQSEVEDPTPGLHSPKVTTHEASNLREEEQSEPQKSVHKAYPTDI